MLFSVMVNSFSLHCFWPFSYLSVPPILKPAVNMHTKESTHMDAHTHTHTLYWRTETSDCWHFKPLKLFLYIHLHHCWYNIFQHKRSFKFVCLFSKFRNNKKQLKNYIGGHSNIYRYLESLNIRSGSYRDKSNRIISFLQLTSPMLNLYMLKYHVLCIRLGLHDLKLLL